MSIETISSQSLEKAVSFLHAGKLVAFATETVYGLGADATNDRAVAEIFAVKGRPQFNPLIVHVDGVKMARQHVVWNERAEKLANAFWPGPLTLVLPRKTESGISLLVSAGGDTLALRMPDHEAALALITASGKPLAAPSANRSGRVSPTTAQHVAEEFGGDVPLILDAGPCRVGIESTVIDISGETPVLLRPGFVTHAELNILLSSSGGVHLRGHRISGEEPALMLRIPQDDAEIVKSPGQLASHYAPSLPVRLNVLRPEAGEALLAFGATVPAGAAKVINLSESGDLKEAAARLFASLRALDDVRFTGIGIMTIPDEGIGMAINDRLRRAALR